MQLVDVLKENLVFLNFEAEDKEKAIEKFIATLSETGAIEEPEVLKEALFEREKAWNYRSRWRNCYATRKI